LIASAERNNYGNGAFFPVYLCRLLPCLLLSDFCPLLPVIRHIVFPRINLPFLWTFVEIRSPHLFFFFQLLLQIARTAIAELSNVTQHLPQASSSVCFISFFSYPRRCGAEAP
jgi:hypothetical protein